MLLFVSAYIDLSKYNITQCSQYNPGAILSVLQEKNRYGHLYFPYKGNVSTERN